MQWLRLPSSGVVPVIALATLIAAVNSSAQDDPLPPEDAESSLAAEPESLNSILDLVREQRKLIEKQQETISALEERLEKVESLALSSHNRLAELDERPPDLEVSTAVETRLAELEASVQELPEKADVVSAGEFPGSFRIPGTDAP
jgi:uncharacterized coiled-coil protein SlyX